MSTVSVGVFCVASVSLLAICASCAYLLLGHCVVFIPGIGGTIFTSRAAHCTKHLGYHVSYNNYRWGWGSYCVAV